MNEILRTRKDNSVVADLFSLHALLTEKHLLEMKHRFERLPGRRMEKNMFRKVLYDVTHISYNDEEFELLFLKLDTSRTLTEVLWIDFLRFLILGFTGEDIMKYSSQLELPIKHGPKEIKSHHRININRITFVPEMLKNRGINHMYGKYVTCSKDGLINYWSIDMEKERTVYSKSPENYVQSTWITDLITFPDVGVICTASTERDLRFYDTTANKFELRVIITNLKFMATTLSYTFYEDANKMSKFLFGDCVGKVRLIHIVSKDRGPFKNRLKKPLTVATFDQLCKGYVHNMKLSEIPTMHTDWVRQVAYYENIHCILSISTCSKQSMLIHNPKGKDCSYSFQVPKGFSCFAIAESSLLVITGGPDCLIRTWNPFVPARAITVFTGHHAGIVSIFLQDDFRIIISLDRDKCIKVWDVVEQICIQSYYGLPSSLGERTPLCTYYNPISRQFFVASMNIVVLQVYPLQNPEYTDGVSHSKEVSVVLYNSLFHVVITCGYDSFIIVWNPWLGKRIKFIREAHTITMQGETMPVEITAATFDPSNQFLITGASDGTLKIWNFNTGTCHRNLEIEYEVCAIIWIKFRILVMGENMGVTEFADSEDVGSSNYKNWIKRHNDDVLCTATYLPQTLVTASHNGELVFWRLETGQSYGMYNILNPRERIQMIHKQIKDHGRIPAAKSSLLLRKKPSLYSTPSATQRRQFKDPSSRMSMSAGSVSINAMVFLTSRKIAPNIGTLLVALENGQIQIWSHHPGGGYLNQFKAVHTLRDYIVSMCTDEENNYIFTGHMAGYIKTWHMVNYGIPEEEHVHVCKPKLRLIFPFMWQDLILGRAKRAHKQESPILLNSFKAHLKAVTGLVYADKNEIIISGSSDGSARLWTLAGRYLGTLGTFKPWTNIQANVPVPKTREFTLPADIQRTASFTTFKVLTGGEVMKKLTTKQEQQQYEQISTESRRTYGRRIDLDSILGKHFKLPARATQHFDIFLDTSLYHVPIYSNLITPQPEIPKCPPTPELARKIKRENETK